MPKVRRLASRAQELLIAPWQERPRAPHTSDEDATDSNVVYADLLTPPPPAAASAAAPAATEATAAAPAPAPAAAAAQPHSAASLMSATASLPWRTARGAPMRPPASPEPTSPSAAPSAAAAAAAAASDAPQLPSSASLTAPQSRPQPSTRLALAAPAATSALDTEDDGDRGDGDGEAALEEEEEEEDGFGLFDDGDVAACTCSCSGVCQLALLPSGQVSGHFVHAASRVCYGVVGEDVAGPSGDCWADDDTQAPRLQKRHLEQDIIRLKLINFKTGRELDSVVAKTGGDLSRLRPAEPLDLFHAFGVGAKQAEHELVVTVRYEATMLLQGAAAEAHLARYSPRLCDSGAVVNVGLMQLAGLPPAFL